MADPWYEDVDEDYIQRCRAIAAEVWVEKLEHAQDRGWGSDEEDQDDPYAGVEVSYHLPGEGYVSVMIGDETVIDYVRVERLEAALLALRGEGKSDG